MSSVTIFYLERVKECLVLMFEIVNFYQPYPKSSILLDKDCSSEYSCKGLNYRPPFISDIIIWPQYLALDLVKHYTGMDD